MIVFSGLFSTTGLLPLFVHSERGACAKDGLWAVVVCCWLNLLHRMSEIQENLYAPLVVMFPLCCDDPCGGLPHFH